MGRLKGSKNGVSTNPWHTCERCGIRYQGGACVRGRFCSNACRQNRVTKACPHCRRTFSVMASKADRFTYCSRGCSRAAAPRIQIFCAACATPFTIRQSQQAPRRFCSRTCAVAAGRAVIVCAYCGVQHTTQRYRVAQGQQCCSTRCATLLRMDQGFEPGSFGIKRRTGYRTDIERMTETVLIRLGIPYLFEHKVGRFSVDFILPTRGIALECDGWQHLTARGRERDIWRDQALAAHGWRVIHISDKAIRTDADHAVRSALTMTPRGPSPVAASQHTRIEPLLMQG
jgi:very-short-patch-repair endonuclease